MLVHFFFHRITYSHQFVTQILTQCVNHLSDCKRTHAFFQQESATAHTANSAVYYLENVGWQNNKQVCVASTFFVGCKLLQFFTLDLLKNKLDNMYNPFMEDDFKELDVCGSVHHSTIHKEKSNKMHQCIKIFIIPYLYEAQHVSGDTPPIIRSLNME